MGVEELPNSGNKFTGSRMIVPGVGLNTFRVQKNDKFAIRRNPFANSINASPTPTPSITPTNTPTPSVTPTLTPTPSSSPPPIPQTFIFSANSSTLIQIVLGFNSFGFSSGGYVDWGDGNTSNISTYVTTIYQNTYSSPYTGVVTVYYFGSMSTFRVINGTLPSNSTVVSVSTEEITTLTSLSELQITLGRLVGQLSELPSTLNFLSVNWDFTNSNTNSLPVNVTTFLLGQQGSTQLTGDISEISNLTNLQILSVGNGNTIYGNISGLTNSSLISMNIQGSNTISGDTVNINLPSLTNMTIFGNNTITGNISNLPPLLTSLTISGSHSLYGNLSDFNINLNNIVLAGNGAASIVGDLSDLPKNTYGVLSFSNIGNSISGDTSTIPNISGATFSVIFNNITGDLSNLFSGNKYPSCIFSITSTNPNSLSYTPGITSWGTETMASFSLQLGSYPLTSTENDNLLIDLDSYGGGVTWNSCLPSKSISLRGTRTAASDAAVTSLNGKGVTVTVTP